MPIDPLLQRLRQLQWPTPTSDHPDPEPGQLWRAAWSDVACLVVILAGPEGRTTRVAGATAEQVGDDATVIASTAHAMAPAVWASVSANIKNFTLEHRITDVTTGSFADLLAAAARPAVGAWAPILDDLDDRALIRADLNDRLHSLAEAEWLPAAGGDAPTLAELAGVASIAPSRLADELGITPGDARRLLQGRRAPAPSELETLTRLLGTEPAVAIDFDEDLVVDIDLPEFRPDLRIVAANEHGGDEVAARRALAGQMMALAARHREPGQRNWGALLRDALRED